MPTQKTPHQIIPPNNDLEILKKNFPHCFDRNGNFDFEKFKKELTTSEVNFSRESYGIDWLGKSYARLLSSDPAKTLIREDKEWNNKEENQNSENLLIKGDNLEVLKHLSNAYHEKIKMIYIDPPYNTGSDGFVYADDRRFTVASFCELAGVDEEQAKRILSFVQSQSNSHSAWLTFMYPRLYIARQLLRDDGVIFVSIDDNEVAQLRILMDEIFGEENFVWQFPWRKRTAKSDVSFWVSQDFEWIISYGKSHFLAGIAHERKYYITPDFPHDGWRLSDLTKQTSADERPNSAFNMIDPKTNKIYPFNSKRTWSVTKETFETYYRQWKIVFPDDYDFLNISIPSYRVFQSEDNAKAMKKYWIEAWIKAVSTQLPKEIGLSEDGNKDMIELFGDKHFSFPKPTALIKYLIDVVNSRNEQSIILDFFAGSGTTGDAVMQLNAEDGGDRRYILVQIPEAIDKKKSKTAYDFVQNELRVEEPTIFDITRERLVRAAAKIGDTSGFQVFETQAIWEDYEWEAKEFDESLRLFDESRLTSEDLQALLTTWKTSDGIPLTESLEQRDLDGYTGYYGENRDEKGKLYLMDTGFETRHLKAVLNTIDEDTDFNPSSIIVFGYHFESKALREISENISSYANKKKLDIDCITRY